MTARRVALVLIALWVLAFAGAFAHFHLAAPTGEGFGRGLNKIVIFLGWQAAALVPALSAYLVVRWHGAALGPRLGRVAHLPLFVSGLAWATLIGLTLWVRYSG